MDSLVTPGDRVRTSDHSVSLLDMKAPDIRSRARRLMSLSLTRVLPVTSLGRASRGWTLCHWCQLVVMVRHSDDNSDLR